MEFSIQVAGAEHYPYAQSVCDLIAEAARERGTGIAKRKPEYVKGKMEEGKAIIALQGKTLAGFCYIETWQHHKYVANSGLIVNPEFRGKGLAKMIKRKAFELSCQKYPDSKIFGITTSLAVMKINSDLGYKPVTFSELTEDEVFWSGCKSCPNFDILTRTDHKMCLCTGMLYSPEAKNTPPKEGIKSQPKEGWGKFTAFLAQRKKRPLYKRIIQKLFPDRLLKFSRVGD